MTGYSKFDGMDRDALFNSNFVARLGITRHMPIQDALLYVLEELNRLDEENRSKNNKIQMLEYEIATLKQQSQRLGPNQGWDPYRSPFTYGPNTISSTSAIGVPIDEELSKIPPAKCYERKGLDEEIC